MAKTSFNNYNPKKTNKVKNKKQLEFLCKCMDCGKLFDYRDRTKYTGDKLKYHAPCEGRCPHCDSTDFTLLSTELYPIKFNFII